MKKLLFILLLNLCLISYSSDLSAIFPGEALPGQTIRVSIKPVKGAVSYTCRNQKHLDYLNISNLNREKITSQPLAYSEKCSQKVSFNVPEMASGYSLWVRINAKKIKVSGKHPNGKNSNYSYGINTDEGEFYWKNVRKYMFAKEFASFKMTAVGGLGIDCVVVSTDPSFNPDINGPDSFFELMGPENFSLTMPLALKNKQLIKIAARTATEVKEDTIAIKLKTKDIVEYFNYPADITWVNLSAYANIPTADKESMLSDNIVNKETLQQSKLNFNLPVTMQKYIAVWAAINEKDLKKREVTVAQDNDKIRSKTDLPASVEIPFSGKAANLAFLHGEKGAGEPGEVVWSYLVNYSDKSQVEIKIREGIHVTGMLKGSQAEAAHLAWVANDINRETKVYFYSWKNPNPEKYIKSITMNAVKTKLVPVLVGLGKFNHTDEKLDANTSTIEKVVEVNLANKVRPVKEKLFSMNNPSISFVKPGYWGAKMDIILNDDSWEFYKQLNFPVDRIWIGKYLAQTEGGWNNYGNGFQYLNQAAQRISRETKTEILLGIKPPKWSYSEGPDLEKRAGKVTKHILDFLDVALKNGWNIKYVELFNETLINHPGDEVQRIYLCFNFISAQIKQKYPQLKIAGTAECWPAENVLRDFVVNCGDNLDAISWHLYPTGRPDSSTDLILKKANQMAISSRNLDKILKEVRKDKKIEQYITEYNLNYAAWKNGGETRQNNGIGALWMMSVMKHLLYDGEAEMANYWHYGYSSAYCVGTNPYKQPTPIGSCFQLLNSYFKGSLCETGSTSELIQTIAVDNGSQYVVSVLNASPETETVKLNIYNFPELSKTGGFYPVDLYRVGNTETEMVKMSLPVSALNNGTAEVVLPGYSVSTYIFAK